MFEALMRFIRNQEKPNGTGFVTVDVDELFSRKNPWYTEVYYSVYRFFKWNWIFHPTQWYYNTKWFIQRGSRGWADRDCWSLDAYIDSWMPAALKHLRSTKHGIPSGMFDGLPTKEGEPWNYTDEAYKMAEARWDSIIGQMITGFEASHRLQDGLYEKELGEYPIRRPDSTSKEDWRELHFVRTEKSKILEDRDEKLRVEGMTLFVKHYSSLWD